MKKVLRFLFAFSFLWGSLLEGNAQTTQIRGKVTSSEDGSSMPGVNVTLKGSNIGAITDANGGFTISADANGTLVFSFIGYKTQEIVIGGRSVIDVSLDVDFGALTEVVVTGYIDQDKRRMVGSVATVDAKTIENVPIASFDQVLQGQAPGLLVLGGSGQPGASATVVIRGKTTLTGSNNPLYVLDGVPIDPTRFATLNPNDFESVSVLKDASATSIYGSRGANGVIVITSKKGKAGKTQFNYNAQYGFSEPPINKLELLNTNEKIDLELLYGGTPLANLTEEEIADLRNINTDWADVLFQRGITKSHEVSARGGNENTTFYISGGVFSQEGIVKTTGLDRYTGRINLNHESGNFRIGTNLSLGYSKSTDTQEGNTFIGAPLNAVRWSNPYETPYDANGNYTAIRTGQPNALQELQENRRFFEDIKVVASANAEYLIPKVEGLSVKTIWGVDYDHRETDDYLDRSTYQGSQQRGQQGGLFRDSRRDARFVGTNAVLYNTSFGTDHTLSAGLFHEINYRQVKSFGFSGFGLTGNLPNEAGLTVSDIFLPALRGGNIETALVSYFTDINYGFKGKYNAKVGFRRDGSSRFGSGNKYANFYSVGASWLVIEEGFLSGIQSTLSDLKFSASYGTSGNQEGIGAFASRELYSTAAGFGYDGAAGIRQSQIESPFLSWEEVEMFNVRLDYGLFNNRVTGSIEFYNNLTNNLFIPSQLSRTTGYTQLSENVGLLRNRGLELAINADVVRSGGFTWNVNANFTQNNNKLLELRDGDEIIQGIVTQRVGYPLNSNLMVEYAGVNPANGDALYRRPDGSLTSQFSSNDLQVWGTRDAPRWGGFTNTFSYKGVELSVFFTWVHGNEIYNNDRTNVENPTYLVDNLARSMLNAWKQPGDITDVPRWTNTYRAQTTRNLENGSFLRLRNVRLSYNLPQSAISRLGLSNARIYAQGQNLFTRTEFLGWDPELPAGTLTGAQYPALRTVIFGLNIGF